MEAVALRVGEWYFATFNTAIDKTTKYSSGGTGCFTPNRVYGWRLLQRGLFSS